MWKMKVCIVKDMMGIAQNKLKFQNHMNITHYRDKVHMSNIF
jgi:hypothetical protein